VTKLGFDVGAHSLLTYLYMQKELGKAIITTARKLLDYQPMKSNNWEKFLKSPGILPQYPRGRGDVFNHSVFFPSAFYFLKFS